MKIQDIFESTTIPSQVRFKVQGLDSELTIYIRISIIPGSEQGALPGSKRLVWTIKNDSETVGYGNLEYQEKMDSAQVKAANITKKYQRLGLYQTVLYLLNQYLYLESDKDFADRLSTSASRVWQKLGADYSKVGFYRLGIKKAKRPERLVQYKD